MLLVRYGLDYNCQICLARILTQWNDPEVVWVATMIRAVQFPNAKQRSFNAFLLSYFSIGTTGPSFTKGKEIIPLHNSLRWQYFNSDGQAKSNWWNISGYRRYMYKKNRCILYFFVDSLQKSPCILLKHALCMSNLVIKSFSHCKNISVSDDAKRVSKWNLGLIYLIDRQWVFQFVFVLRAGQGFCQWNKSEFFTSLSFNHLKKNPLQIQKSQKSNEEGKEKNSSNLSIWGAF